MKVNLVQTSHTIDVKTIKFALDMLAALATAAGTVLAKYYLAPIED